MATATDNLNGEVSTTLNLIVKDLLMHKTGFPVYTPIVVGVMALQAWRGFAPSIYVTLVCIYAVIWPAALIAIEDRVCAGPFNCSLPVTRRQIAGAKYVLSWAIAMLAALIGLAIYSIIAANNLADIWTVTTISQVLAILSLGLGLSLPILMRFGWIGIMVSYFGIITLVAVAALVAVALVPGQQLKDSIVDTSKFIHNTVANLGELNFLLLVILFGALLNFLSYLLGVKLFQRREY